MLFFLEIGTDFLEMRQHVAKHTSVKIVCTIPHDSTALEQNLNRQKQPWENYSVSSSIRRATSLLYFYR